MNAVPICVPGYPSTLADDLMAASAHSGAPPAVWIGACTVDCATGQMLVGQWLDDELRSQVCFLCMTSVNQ